MKFNIKNKSLIKTTPIIIFILFISMIIIPSSIKSDYIAVKLKLEDSKIIKDHWSRKITVSSDDDSHYYNIPVSITIPENLLDVQLYRYLDPSLMKIVTDDSAYDFQVVDSDGNYLADTATWVVPELSEVSFSVEGTLTQSKTTTTGFPFSSSDLFQTKSGGGFTYIEKIGSIFHIWNDKNDYYINETGLQLTNSYDDYWTHNVWCLFVNISNRYVRRCSDAMNWTWANATDNSNYVELNGTATYSEGSYSAIFRVRYYLANGYDKINISISLENTGRDITDMYYGWLVKDVRIGENEANDVYRSKDLSDEWHEYNLSDNLALEFNETQTKRYYMLKDNVTGLSVEFWWDSKLWKNDVEYDNTPFKLNLTHSMFPNQYNTPVLLMIHIGSLNSGGTAYTNLWWVDAAYATCKIDLCTFYSGGSVSCGPATNGCNPGNVCMNFACTLGGTTCTSGYCDTCGDCTGGGTGSTCAAVTCGTTNACESPNVCDGQDTDISHCVAPAGEGATCYCQAMCSSGYTCNATSLCQANDAISPTFSLNSTNSTVNGTAILHSLNWTDNVALSGYIFSFYNGSNTTTTSTYNWTSPDQELSINQSKGNNTLNTYGTGWMNPNNNTKLTAVGWANPTNAYTISGQTYATANGQFTNQTEYYFSPNIPAGATILGIQVRTNVSTSSSSGTKYILLKLSNDSGVSYKGNVYKSCNNYQVNIWQDITNGSIIDTWGLIWTVSNVNNIKVNVTGYGSTTARYPYLDWVGMNITYQNYTESIETNKSWSQPYNGIDGSDYPNVDKVGAIIQISNYTPSASNSTYNNNRKPDIEVGVYNGTSYVNGSYCNINNTMGNNLPNNTAWNCSINTTNSVIMTAWKYQANRSVIIRGIFIDTNATIADEINVTAVYGYVDAYSITTTDLVNDTWTSFGGNTWSNVTKTVNSTVGASISWCVYANDTSNIWNGTSCINPFSYLTTTSAANIVEIIFSQAYLRGIIFSSVTGNSIGNPAGNNTSGPSSGTEYNITVGSSSTQNLDFYAKLNSTFESGIYVNESSSTNSATAGFSTNKTVNATWLVLGNSTSNCTNIAVNNNCWNKLYLDVGSVTAGYKQRNFTICGLLTGNNPSICG